MLKISLRPNLKYPINLIIWNFLRKIISILISGLFHFNASVIYTFLMFLGELIGGYLVYRYQRAFIKNSNKKAKKIKLVHFSIVIEENKMARADGLIKISFLVIMTAFFDFFEFILSTYYIDKIHKISGSLQLRLGGVLILASSLLYWHLLKFQIYKHHIFSLIIFSICIIILIISEYFFQEFDGIINIKDLSFAILLSIFSYLSIAFEDNIEKYLIEFYFLNPFLILCLQGLIGLIFTIICATIENPLKDFIIVFENNSTGMIVLFILLLIFYFLFGALKNIYRMTTIMLFNPMNKNLADIIINPLYIIYYFISGADFMKIGEKNYAYFLVNFVLLIIFDICGLIFNEFLILFWCGLNHNTYKSITFRAAKIEEMNILQEEDENSDKSDSNYY